MSTAHKLAEVFTVLKPDLSVEPVKVSAGIYEELNERFDQFRSHALISEYQFTDDWPSWERHPAGDEVVVLLSGEVEMVLRTGAGDESVRLNETGSYVIVPAGTWHTARPSAPTRMLFITPGEATEHSEAPPQPKP